MGPYKGDFTTSDTVYVMFDSFSSDDPSASVTLTGLAVTDIEIYKNGGTTQRASDAGYTLLDTDGIDFDSITGIHGFSIDLSDNTDAGFYTSGGEFDVIVSSVTIDGATINFHAASFSIDRTPKVNTTEWNSVALSTTNPLPNAAAGAAGGLPTDAVGTTDLIDDIWDEVLTGAAHNVTNSAGKRLRLLDDAFEVHSGTCQAGSTSTTIVLDTGASGTDDIYNGDRVVITGGTGAQEHGIIIDYNGTTKTATMAETWVVTPDNTSEFEIVPADTDVETWQHNVVTASASGLPDVNVNEVGDTSQTAGDLAALITTLDTVADGIQTDLDNGTDGLGALKTLIDTVDTVVDAIKVVTDALPDSGALTTLQADTDDIQTRLPAALVGGKMDCNVGAISTSTTAADNLEASALGVVPGACEGTPSTTVVQTDLAEATDDHYIGRIVVFTSGNAAGEATDITDYTGSTGTITVTALTTAPAATDTFVIV